MSYSVSKAQWKKWADNICFMMRLKKKALFCVSNRLEAKMAENAGAGGVIVVDATYPIEVERLNNDSKMAKEKVVQGIMDSVAIPVFVRIHAGSEVECNAVSKMRADGVEETELASAEAGYAVHVNKHKRKRPFICGASTLAEALRRVQEGASMICIKGNAYDDHANPVQAIEDIERINREIATAAAKAGNEQALRAYARELCANYAMLKQVAQLRRLQVPLFAAGCITQPSDAAHMMDMGCAGVVVSNLVFHAPNPARRANAIVTAIQHPNDYSLLNALSETVDD
ncbi:Pyridoxal 5'-phosphate synthase subunit snz1 [Coemansia sp. RSA 1813]|nr:Pyridoxal 5'-phosphate synthase subunit snz1 [Coemansia sp. RSA 1646]KAJ1771686.1 Pyridoxal 5'-phosphate synthase subunit snz1 [Coemansia sp. RSA 1843]KAJ2089677.1 Pyridoxal 5'-phosphate synthase subunit snz1 [Coemansia sp. RSA 986]KAJ2214127.1 Pyridoxal 5'-phosphate synthase subunit snz1 [Coemansia sp. RSA 487]KAJ2569185.1 Pyridoxal 5'-phosphate synthase subunit snz1 [Coemansia sp. RSA 1813]